MNDSVIDNKDYYLGLDLGTGSLGWAVTDEDYELMRSRGKDLWGVRLFESADTAEERRGFRTSRRRLNRRKQRIELLQSIFAQEINKIDDGFFHRMKESRYAREDKRDIKGDIPKLPYALFVDENYNDKDYHSQFPTIYHLRKWLMTTEDTPDIRLVYLGLHHMMKHRGHFLLPGSSMESVKDFKAVFKNMINVINNEELDFNISAADIDAGKLIEIENILRESKLTKKAKKDSLIKISGSETACEKAVLGLMSGSKSKLSDIFGDKELNEPEKLSISFSDGNYDENSAALEVRLGERFAVIESIKAVYDWAVLADILGEYSCISEAKTAVYEKHQKDLRYLKKLVRENLPNEVYEEIFINTNDKTANYSAYIGMTKIKGRKADLEGKRCSREDFYKFLKKKINNGIDEEIDVSYFHEEVDKETFLPRQVSKDNSVIPYQINLYELNRIIENLKDRVPLLAEEGEKIKQIFTFRIPYYVGPLNGIKRGGKDTNWAVRRSDEKIYPWNFDDVIDREASAEKFIRRMTNKCTYLINEDVLPKNSLLYSKFMVLNELNNIKINGEPISVEYKKAIYSDLFERKRKVTQKKLKEYLVTNGIAEESDDITGVDGDFKGSLTAYHDFKEKLTDSSLSQMDKENIILNITLFGEDQKLLKQRLKGQYPELTEGQIKALCSLRYKGWGRLSKKFLDEIAAPLPETGEMLTIIGMMWETNDNLMQILSEKYGFAGLIEQENHRDSSGDITYKMVENLYVSPAVRRQIWQTLQVVKELCKVMDAPPKRIFVEMAREKQGNDRTRSRKSALTELYKKCKEEERDWIAELEGMTDQDMRRDKLYLYYTQKGRCMYSGESIELSQLWDNSKYDIDHIYPQSKVMDDSLDNRVLVKKTINEKKTDIYPISAEIRNKMRPFWRSLLDGGFISKEKYNRLIRSTGFEDSELAGFIARQLVETRQGTKAVASVLKQAFPDTEIVYVKAKIVSQFRQDHKLIKVRELNDLHHAKDAYLNVVVGNAYFVKFTKSASWFIKENPGRSYNLKTMLTSESKYDITRNGETAWKAGEDGTIRTVKKIMNKNSILVTRRAYEVKGGLFDQQLMKKGKGQVPIKGSDERLHNIEKYGGYNKATGTYFMLIESLDKKGKTIQTIEYMPLYLAEKLKTEAEILDYLKKDRELNEPKIKIAKIKTDSLFKVDGFYMWLSGRTENRLIFKGANQLLLSDDNTRILKKATKFAQRKKDNDKNNKAKDIKIVEADGINEQDLLRLYDTFLDKLKNTVYSVRLSAQVKTLEEKRDKFIELSLEDKCVVLAEILHMFQCNSSKTNLEKLGGGKAVGEVKISKKITQFDQASIIYQSVTGIYEKEVDLKKI